MVLRPMYYVSVGINLVSGLGESGVAHAELYYVPKSANKSLLKIVVNNIQQEHQVIFCTSQLNGNRNINKIETSIYLLPDIYN